MAMNIPCWIISLDPSAPLAAALGASLAAQGVEFRFVPAVDGRSSEPALEGTEVLDVRKAMLRHGKPLTNSELGCYLAHFRAVRDAWDAGLERVCIMEDDVGLEDDFARVLRGIGRLPPDVEMVRLMALRIRKRKVIAMVPGCTTHQLVRPERGWCGGQAYVLNRRAMRKFLDHARVIFEPIDKLIDHFFEFDLRLYGVEPHVCYEHEHVTSIQKMPAQRRTIPLLVRFLKPFHKLAFSRARHAYLRAHEAEFYPAEWPPERMGRTVRLR